MLYYEATNDSLNNTHTPLDPSLTGWGETDELDDLVFEEQAVLSQSHSLEPQSLWGVLRKNI